MSKKKAIIPAVAEKKNKGGQPSKFGAADMRLVRYATIKGATDEELASLCDVHVQTIYNWKKAHPEFFENLKCWKQEADEKVERSLYERATGYNCKETKMFCHEGMIVTEDLIKHYPPDPTSCIFWLKNRKPKEWRDRIENANINMSENETYEDYLARISGAAKTEEKASSNGPH